jgi:hypothetical protein
MKSLVDEHAAVLADARENARTDSTDLNWGYR